MLTGITLTLERLNRYNDHVHHLSGARYMLTFVKAKRCKTENSTDM